LERCSKLTAEQELAINFTLLWYYIEIYSVIGRQMIWNEYDKEKIGVRIEDTLQKCQEHRWRVSGPPDGVDNVMSRYGKLCGK